MGNLISRFCGEQGNPLLSLNGTCQRLRCLMACFRENVNVTTTGEVDCVDAATQVEDEDYEETAKETSV